MLRTNFWRVALLGILGLLAGIGYVLFSPRLYEARLEMLVGTQPSPRAIASPVSEEVGRILERGATQGIDTERQLLSSVGVFAEAAQVVASERPESRLAESWPNLYEKYEVVTARRPTSQPGLPEPGVALLKVRAYDPDVALAFANRISTVYSELRRRNATEAANQAAAYLESQVQKTERDLASARDRARRLKERLGFTDFGVTARDATALRSSLVQQLTQNNEQLATVTAELRELRRAYDRQPEIIRESWTVARNPQVDRLIGQISDLQQERQRLREQFLDDSIPVREVDSRIAAARRDLAAEQKRMTQEATSNRRLDPIKQELRSRLITAEANRQRLIASRTALETELRGKDAELKLLPQQEAQIRAAETDIVVFEEQYRTQKSQLEDVKLRGQLAVVPVTIVSPATLNPLFREPDPIRFPILGLLAGSIFGLMISFIGESVRPRVTTSSQLASLTGRPVMAVLPNDAKALADGMLSQPGPRPSEAFRYMASAYMGRSAPPHTFLICGTTNHRRVSESAVQLAMAFAEAGQRTLLIDSSFRRPEVTNRCNLTGQNGLTEVIAGTVSVAEAAAHLASGVHVLGIGRELAPNGALNPVDVGVLMEQARQIYDAVVVITMPCEAVADAAAFAPHVGEAVLVLSAFRTTYQEVSVGQELMLRAGAKSVALVLAGGSQQDEPFLRSVPALEARSSST